MSWFLLLNHALFCLGKHTTKKYIFYKETKQVCNWAGSKTTTLFDLWLTLTCPFICLIYWAVLMVTSILIVFPRHCLNLCVSSFCPSSLLLSRMDAQTLLAMCTNACTPTYIYTNILPAAADPAYVCFFFLFGSSGLISPQQWCRDDSAPLLYEPTWTLCTLTGTLYCSDVTVL